MSSVLPMPEGGSPALRARTACLRPVLVKGAGELATGVAWRLFRAGFPVFMTEVARPLAVRRAVAFAEAVPLGEWTVEGVTARRAGTVFEAVAIAAAGAIPVLVDPEAACRAELAPWAVVDALMAKRNLGTAITDAPAVVALGPGFTAGVDCHAVVETMRGHALGRVYYSGPALPDTGIPAERGGESARRVVRAPAGGVFRARARIGERVDAGAVLGHVEAVSPGVPPVPVRAPIAGTVRGLLRDGTPVTPGLKAGDIDPEASPEWCFTISDKALAVAGGVLEALLVLARRETGCRET